MDRGSQLTPQILTFRPLPIHQYIAFLTRLIALWKLLQRREGQDLMFVVKTVLELKYLDFRICPTRDLKFCNSLQTCFANMALLKAYRSLKPSLHWDLTSPSFSHFLWWIPYCWVVFFYQNLDMAVVICWQTL